MCEDCERNGIPPQVAMIGIGAEQMAEMMNHRRMQVTDKKAAVVDLLSRLSRDDMAVVENMLAEAMDDKFMTGMFIGMIKGTTISRFDTNFDGQTMEEAMHAEAMVREAEQHRDGPEPEGGGIVADAEYMREKFDIDPTPRDTSNDPAWKFPPNTHDPATGAPLREDGYPMEDLTMSEIEEGMRRYNLKPSEILGRYICTKCGMEYVSITDRALRDDCHGCLARAAQG